MSVFVHAQGIKTVHVVVECPQIEKPSSPKISYPFFIDDPKIGHYFRMIQKYRCFLHTKYCHVRCFIAMFVSM